MGTLDFQCVLQAFLLLDFTLGELWKVHPELWQNLENVVPEHCPHAQY